MRTQLIVGVALRLLTQCVFASASFFARVTLAVSRPLSVRVAFQTSWPRIVTIANRHKSNVATLQQVLGFDI